MSDWNRVEGYLGQDALAQLGGKSVAIVGLGSGGGFVALALAMSGVGRFILVDDDTLEPANIVRHVADLRYVGKPKVEAVADLIRQRNPNASVETVVGRMEANIDRLHSVDLVVVGVDGERSKYEINVACRAAGLVAIYAGVYERGEGGDVVIIRPDDGPCYACWSERLRDNMADVVPGETELDYGMIGPDGTIAAEPGLWLHVTRIASAQADMALNDLLIGQSIHRTLPANTVIMANVEMEIYEGVVVDPYSAAWIDIPRNPRCMVCGDQHAESLSLNSLAGDLIVEDSDELTQAKTGKTENGD